MSYINNGVSHLKKIETASDAVLLLRMLNRDSDGPPGGMAADMIETIERGILPQDLLLLRLQIVLIRDDAIMDWGDEITTSMNSLESFLFSQCAGIAYTRSL